MHRAGQPVERGDHEHIATVAIKVFQGSRQGRTDE